MHQGIRIPFSSPSIDEQEMEAVHRVLHSKWLTTGHETHEFEKEFLSAIKNISNDSSLDIEALAVQSCTAGLHLAYMALDTQESHSVISTPLTFVSTVSTAIHCGARIEFIDTAPNSLFPNADSLDALKQKTSQHILSIVPITGHHPHYQDLIDLARHRGLHVLEDVAHAFPAHVGYKDKKYSYGEVGDIGVFSFYANKTITSGEGGMVLTNNHDYLQKIHSLRNHGMDRPSWNRHKDKPEQFSYDIKNVGYKYNLPDILAAIGRVQLAKAHELHQKRVLIAKLYQKYLSERDYWILPEIPEDDNSHAWHIYVIQIVHPKLTRDDFMQKLKERGIATSVHYTPLHIMSYFKNNYGLKHDDFPNAFATFQKILSLPLYPDLDEENLEYICKSLLEIGDNY